MDRLVPAARASCRAPRSRGLVFFSSCAAAALTLATACFPGFAVGPNPPASPSPVIGSSPAAVTTAAIAEVGDRCVARFACSTDHLTFLRCDGEKMVVHGLCRGPRHCEVGERGLRCDQSIGEIGDACDDGATCSLDGLNMLVCRDGRLTQKAACSTGCEIQRKHVECHGMDSAP